MNGQQETDQTRSEALSDKHLEDGRSDLKIAFQ